MESNRDRADRIVIDRAAGRLAAVDMSARAKLLGLSPPGRNGDLRIPVLGRRVIVAPPFADADYEDSGEPARPVDHILARHYLLCDMPLDADGPPLTFRDLPGGQFYWGPFRSRTILPLVSAIGDRLDLLRARLDRFECEPFPTGDVGRRVRCVGTLGISLAYYAGDDEFQPSAELFFDAAVRRAFQTDVAAAMAQRLCSLLCGRS